MVVYNPSFNTLYLVNMMRYNANYAVNRTHIGMWHGRKKMNSTRNIQGTVKGLITSYFLYYVESIQ